MVQQKVRILADATFDLPLSWVKDLNIGILPTQIMISDRDKLYRNYVDITPSEFFEKLESVEVLPKTTVPKQGDIYKTYDESLQKFDSLIVLTHSSKISGSYNIAKKVADMFHGKDITVIDSNTISIMQGLLVYEAAKMAQNGASKEDIILRLKELIPHTHGIAILKSLDYLRKGGRISIAKNVIGNLANLRPIIAVEDGLVKNIGRVKGFNKGIELIKEKIPMILKNRKSDFVVILHALMQKEADELKKFIMNQKENVPNQVEVFLIGPVLGTHMGPYCLGIGWIGDWSEKWFR